jgi:hypothetical protein
MPAPIGKVKYHLTVGVFKPLDNHRLPVHQAVAYIKKYWDTYGEHCQTAVAFVVCVRHL